MVGDVLARSGVRVAEMLQHGAHVAVGGGLMGEVALVPHVGGFDARNAAELFVEGQWGEPVDFPVLIQQIHHDLLLHQHGLCSIIMPRRGNLLPGRGGKECHLWEFSGIEDL